MLKCTLIPFLTTLEVLDSMGWAKPIKAFQWLPSHKRKRVRSLYCVQSETDRYKPHSDFKGQKEI